MVTELHGNQGGPAPSCLPHDPLPRRLPSAREGPNGRLLGILGHELRSPLSAITMAACMLTQRNRLGEEDQRTVALIQRSAARMARLLQQILGCIADQAGARGALDREETDLVQVAADVIAELELTHPDRDFQLRILGPTMGSWDRLGITEVLSNLLANAAQYGVGGRPISLTILGDEQALDLRVHNEGCPIASESLPHIFEPFWRARPEPSPSGNLGLGLHIVREIIEAHGGTIQVSSSESDGTTFAVHLPRR